MNDTYDWYLSTNAMTVHVTTDAHGFITKAAPIVRVFVGQPIENLVGWMMRQGGLRVTLL